MRDSTVMGRETTEGPLFPKLKSEPFGTRETADVEAGEMDEGDGGSCVGGLTIGGDGGEGEGERDLGGPGDNSGTSLSLSDVSELPPCSSLGLLAIFQQFLHPTMFSPSKISTEVNILSDSSTLGICENLFQRGCPLCADVPAFGTLDSKAEKGLLLPAGEMSAKMCRR